MDRIICNCVTIVPDELCSKIVVYAKAVCPTCHGLGFEERGCGNCYCKDDCEIRLMPLSEGEKIDYCTAWEAKQ